MSYEKPECYSIPTTDFVKGDQIAIEWIVRKPVKGAPTKWWRKGNVLSVTSSYVMIETMAFSIEFLTMPVKNVVYRKPWADELVRKVLAVVDLKKKYKYKLPKGYAGEMGRLRARNGDAPRIEWR